MAHCRFGGKAKQPLGLKFLPTPRPLRQAVALLACLVMVTAGSYTAYGAFGSGQRGELPTGNLPGAADDTARTSHAHVGAQHHDTEARSPAVGPPAAKSRPSVSSPAVSYTLSLINNTLYPGNYLAPEAIFPVAVAYDPVQNEVFVAGEASDTVSVLDDYSNVLIENVTVNSEPTGIVFDSSKSEIFVASYIDDDVQVISAKDFQVFATIPVGAQPIALAYDNVTGQVWVANDGGSNVTVISDKTNGVVATVNVGENPQALAYDSGMDEMFVANSNTNNVSVVSTLTDRLVATIPVGKMPTGLAYDSGKGEIYVANGNSFNISVISDKNNAIVASIAESSYPLPFGSYPYAVAYDASLGEIFDVNQLADNVSVISDSTNSIVSTVNVGNLPYAIAYDSKRGTMYVVNAFSDNVSVISDVTNTVVDTVEVGAVPTGVAYDDENDEIYVVNSDSSTVSAISTLNDSIVSTISVGVGSTPEADVFDSGKNEIFVAESLTSSVCVISGTNNTVVADIGVGLMPYGLAYDPEKGEVFVTNQESDTVSVISDANDSLVASVPVGVYPTDLVFDSNRGEVFVGNIDSDNVSVINDRTDTVSGTVGLSSSPEDLVFDTSANQIFVSSGETDDVSIISDTTNRVVSSVDVGGSSYGLAFDGNTNDIFVTVGNNVSVISGSNDHLIDTFAVGTSPMYLAYDPSTGYVYLTNNGQGTLSLISDGSLSPELGAVQLHPGSVVVGAGQYQVFNATPVCNVGVCPYGTTFSWSLTNSSLGILNSTLGSSVFFLASTHNGSLSIYVNATLNGTTKGAQGTIDITTLESVSVSPETIVIDAGGSANLTAVPVCAGGICPSKVAFGWTLNNGLGVLSQQSGQDTVFTAGLAPGNATVYLKALLNGVVRNSSATITITAVPIPELLSVVISPNATTLGPGETGNFSAMVECSLGPCPTDTAYYWSLNNSLGSLSSSNNTSAEFIAGQTGGEVTLTIAASLNGVTLNSTAAISILRTSSLLAVEVTPFNVSLPQRGVSSFSATPECVGGTCPAGVQLTWALNNSLGTLSSTSGSLAIFTAGSTPGAVRLTVTATLSGTSRNASANITITPPTILSVSIYPSSATLAAKASLLFSAAAVCSVGDCPSGVSFEWEAVGGSLNSSTIPSVTFTAGSHPGSYAVVVSATFDGKTVKDTAVVTVTAAPSPPGTDWYAYIGLAAMAVILFIAVAILLNWGQKSREGTKPSKAKDSEPIREAPPAQPQGENAESETPPAPESTA